MIRCLNQNLKNVSIDEQKNHFSMVHSNKQKTLYTLKFSIMRLKLQQPHKLP